jgi:N-acetylglucosaminyldiphosphoundecaprenol N-acetyl-beta-D-mannosaminyltransferase
MLFLGITSPKKEIFLGNWGPTLGVPVLHGVGGSFDVVAGITRRAPVRWQRMGLEWAYRTLQEPRRMWRRYLTTNTRFMVLLGSEMVRPTKRYRSEPVAPTVSAATASIRIHIPPQRSASSSAESTVHLN